MRCKNCGSNNDDNLYICQNCGSPLYDEEDTIEQEDRTRVMEPIKAKDGKNSQPIDEDDKKDKNKSLTIIIIVLCVVLAALVAGIIAIAAHNSKAPEQEQTQSTTEYLSESTTEYQTESTTEQTTTTTTTTTTTQTTVKTYLVALACNDGGEVEGDGEYDDGDKAIIIARADDGYEFDGWYEGNKKVTDSTTYRFTVKDNRKLTAKFLKIDEGDTEENLDEEYETLE